MGIPTKVSKGISIHALREEGDIFGPFDGSKACDISIHALREEGDNCAPPPCLLVRYFYPRPPRGGRPQTWENKQFSKRFLSTPSARRATKDGNAQRCRLWISIHALREEGDVTHLTKEQSRIYFYPRPPRGGRPTGVPGAKVLRNFYPRPPRGGRQQKQRQNLYFLINYTTFCTNLEEP